MKFRRYYIDVFDASLKKYGGFNHFLAYTILRGKLDHLTICLRKEFKFEIANGEKASYWNGIDYCHIWIGFIVINYGT